ncbi:MAG: adenylate/guanylate cyclase domain-containing protein, partial [Ilumatobacteraceae bacterium]
AVVDHGGYVFSTAGDAFAAAFGRAGDAIPAARAAQAALAAELWPDGVVVRVRMGIHTGEAQEREGDYFGPVLNRAARIMSAGHGGQVLLSASTAALLDGAVLVDLGEHRLKDLSEPLGLYQLGDDTFPAIATLSADSGGLPVQRTELLGRADDVAAVAELVGAHRLVTLVGFGGIGKTRLALAAAAEVAARFPRGVHFVDFAPIADGSLVGLAALEAAGISASRLGGDGSVHDRAAVALAGQDLLLVLDNCEHVVDDIVEFVDRLLELSDTPAVLATSREALEIDGERRYRVSPLEVEDGDTSSPAVELFVQRATAAGGRVEVTDPAVREVCQRLDGVPLAIELAAARTSLMSVRELADRLGRQLDVLTSRRRRGRHRSLEAVLEWSWELLADDVADLLVQLAVFSGGWTLEAAGAICDDPDTVADRLETLVACSLVEVADGATATRFWMLEPVRQFAAARLNSDPRHDRLHDRHLSWWVQHATARRVGEQWFSGRWAAELGNEFDNLRQAVNHAVDTERVEDAAALLGAIHAFSMDGFRSAELDLLADAVLRAWSDPPARFWLASAINLNAIGDYRRQAQRLGIALERAADEGDVACEAFAAAWVSSSLANTDPERARALADTALTAARLADDPDLLVLSLAWTAMTALINGDTPTALEQFDQADQVTIGHWSIATSQLHLTRAFVALDVPEAGDPETLLKMSYTGAPRDGFHSRLPVLYRAFPRARAEDVPAVAGAIDEAFELSVAHGVTVPYADVSIAAAELLENLGRLDDAAAIIAALHRQAFNSHMQYHRYRQARSRLPSAPTPNRQLTVPELHDIVRTRVANVTGQLAATGTRTDADSRDLPRS